MGGHLTCLQTVPFELLLSGDPTGTMAATTIPIVREAAEAQQREIEARLAREDVPWDWQVDYTTPALGLVAASPLADLVVMGPFDTGTNTVHPSRLVGEAALRTRTPVMVIPQAQQGLDLSRPAMIGWNGSAEAAHALRAAVPLLARSGPVVVAEVVEEGRSGSGEIAAQAAAAYLSRHAIGCEVVSVARGAGGVAAALFAEASARGCGLVVMGAYGHSRLAELVLGGVTRTALACPPLPLLLAH